MHSPSAFTGVLGNNVLWNFILLIETFRTTLSPPFPETPTSITYVLIWRNTLCPLHSYNLVMILTVSSSKLLLQKASSSLVFHVHLLWTPSTLPKTNRKAHVCIFWLMRHPNDIKKDIYQQHFNEIPVFNTHETDFSTLKLNIAGNSQRLNSSQNNISAKHSSPFPERF